MNPFRVIIKVTYETYRMQFNSNANKIKNWESEFK